MAGLCATSGVERARVYAKAPAHLVHGGRFGSRASRQRDVHLTMRLHPREFSSAAPVTPLVGGSREPRLWGLRVGSAGGEWLG
jgi:hypothetical protein